MAEEEKTGAPTAPRSKYAAMARVPSRPPRSSRQRKTPKVCRVKGTMGSGRGMVIQPQTARMAVIRATRVRSRTEKPRLRRPV